MLRGLAAVDRTVDGGRAYRRADPRCAMARQSWAGAGSPVGLLALTGFGNWVQSAAGVPNATSPDPLRLCCDGRARGLQRTQTRAARCTGSGRPGWPCRSRRSSRTARRPRSARPGWPPGHCRRTWRSRSARAARNRRTSGPAGRGRWARAGRAGRPTRRRWAAGRRRPARSRGTTRSKGRSRPLGAAPRRHGHGHGCLC
jgi:hypothetical protein